MSTEQKRIYWGNEENYAVARSFVALRINDPFTSDTKLLVKAMKDALPEDKWRSLAAMSQAPQVKSRIKTLWEAAVTAPPEPIKASIPAPAPEPVVITVEVEKPIDFKDLAERLDGPTIAALAMSRLEKGLAQLSLARVELPKAPEPSKPPISIIAAASQPRLPRVAVVTLPSQFGDIRAKVNGLSDRLDIRYVDSERSNNDGAIARVDYAIVFSATGHHNWNKAKEYLPSERVFFVEGIARGVQKLFDIASLKRG